MKKLTPIFYGTTRLVVMSSIASLFFGCASMLQPVTTTNSSLTQGNVEMSLHPRITSKAEVLEKFGSPNIVTRDGNGKEVWTYQRAMQASQKDSLSSFWTLLLAGQSRHQCDFENTSKMITLIINFNSRDIVEDFHSRSSNF